jgi:RNA polymerase subunit RPABC4/transcription elongation factor Spt4
MKVLAGVAYYRCSNITQAKLYIPANHINITRRHVKLLYRGLEFTTSASPSNSRARGVKVYIPVRILEMAGLTNSKPNRALIDIRRSSGEQIEIISFGWKCKICEELTLEDDELCWSHRINGDDSSSLCRRCGRPIFRGELCDECGSRILRAYMPYPMS